LFLAVTISAIFFPQFVLAADKGCEGLRKDLELKRQQLAQYLVTLDKFQGKGEAELESLLKYKINELLDNINNAEELTDCSGWPGSVTHEGMSPVKTDSGEYVTKSCAELRIMLLQLLRKSKALKRREHSSFSELTPVEKAVLQECEREFRTVNTILKARCPRDVGGGSKRDGNKRKEHK
jgi:hypothetical protein